MTAPLFLPLIVGLLVAGWMFGRHWDAALAWLDELLEADDRPVRPVIFGRGTVSSSSLRLVPRPFNYATDDSDDVA